MKGWVVLPWKPPSMLPRGMFSGFYSSESLCTCKLHERGPTTRDGHAPPQGVALPIQTHHLKKGIRSR